MGVGTDECRCRRLKDTACARKKWELVTTYYPAYNPILSLGVVYTQPVITIIGRVISPLMPQDTPYMLDS